MLNERCSFTAGSRRLPHHAVIVAKVHRGVVAAFVGVCGGSLLLVFGLILTGTVNIPDREDEIRILGLLGFLTAWCVACVLVMMLARIVITADGRLIKGAIRFREVDLNKLREISTWLERAALYGPTAVKLVDHTGRSVTLPDGYYDRTSEVLAHIADAVEAANLPLSGLLRDRLSRAAHRPVGEDQANRRRTGMIEARRHRLRLAIHGATGLGLILFPLLPLLGGAVSADAPKWVQPVGIALVAVSFVAWLAVVVRQIRRRLTIDEAGRMRVDSLLGTRLLDLASLTAVRMVPDKPYYEHNRHAPPAGRIPRIVLSDLDGRVVHLRADDYWSPAHPVFARILDAVADRGLPLSEQAGYALRWLAGRADPEF